jgi:hypothetical protein
VYRWTIGYYFFGYAAVVHTAIALGDRGLILKNREKYFSGKKSFIFQAMEYRRPAGNVLHQDF